MYRHIKEHNNYDLTLGNVYPGRKYKQGWIIIYKDDKGNRVIYREDSFIRVQKE